MRLNDEYEDEDNFHLLTNFFAIAMEIQW